MGKESLKLTERGFNYRFSIYILPDMDSRLARRFGCMLFDFFIQKFPNIIDHHPHLLHGAIKPGFELPLEIFHTKAPVGLNNV